MITNLSPLVAFYILLFPQIFASQVQPTIQCPSLSPNQRISRIHCENYDGSVVEVHGPGPFLCKLSYVAIRSESSEGSINQQQESLSDENGKCELFLLQFSDDGLVHQSCCGEAGEGLVNRHSRKGELQDSYLDPMQQPLDIQGEVPESFQHLQTNDGAVSEDDEGDEVETDEYWSEDEEGVEEGDNSDDSDDIYDEEEDYDDDEEEGYNNYIEEEKAEEGEKVEVYESELEL
ncbi:hypothetical protein FGADI_13543 [Fusarium gaditjirri]|uniref:Uncharacterized protein n=1 Tax=Fusarium gaditjirri TaxID=282569 RepID=A0A8H4SPJ6_9HYPO|nr:hypothetical protein FGADI_13543 [Fusarium gaditjirri]